MRRGLLGLLLGAAVLAVLSWTTRSGCHQPPEGADAAQAAGADVPATLKGLDPDVRGDVTKAKRLVSRSGRLLNQAGHPVPGATLWIRDLDGIETTVGRTEADGTFEVAVPRGYSTLFAGFPDGCRAWIDLRESVGGAADLCLRLQGVEVLEGSVRGPDGEGVASAAVSVYGYRFGRATSSTAADGTFRVPVPARMEFRLHVEAGVRGRLTRYGLWWAEDTPIQIVLPPVFTLTGRVVRRGAEGADVAVPGVRVQAFAFQLAYYGGRSAHGGSYAGDGVLTGADGRFTYPGIVDCDELRVVSTEWYQPEGPLRWNRDEEPVLVVCPCASVAGTVVGPQGRSVPRAEVSLAGRSRRHVARRTATGSNGEFLLPGVAVGDEGLRVQVTHGALRGSAAIVGRAGQDVTDLVVRLEASLSVRGRIVDSEGRPVTNARICADWIEVRDDGSRVEGDEMAWSDGDGEFLVTDLPAQAVVLTLFAGGCEPLTVGDVLPTRQGAEVGLLTLQLHPEQCVRVTDELGAVLATASVAGRPVDAEGLAVIRPSQDADFRLSVSAPAYVARSIPRGERPGEGDWTVALSPSHVIAGRVIDTDGLPICCAEVRAWGPGGGHKTFSNLAGRFRLEVPLEGTLSLSAWDLFHDYPSPVDVESDGPESLIQAVVAFHVAGRLLDADGQGVQGITVFGNAEGVGDHRTRCDTTDVDGGFRIERLVGRTLELFASHSDLAERGLRARRAYGVRPYAEDVLLRAESSSVVRGHLAMSGCVVWEDGRPAAGVTVFLEAEDDWDDDEAESDADGSFQFENLPAGSYELQAWDCMELDEEREIEYEGVAEGVAAGATGVRVVLREVPPEEDED